MKLQGLMKLDCSNCILYKKIMTTIGNGNYCEHTNNCNKCRRNNRTKTCEGCHFYDNGTQNSELEINVCGYFQFK